MDVLSNTMTYDWSKIESLSNIFISLLAIIISVYSFHFNRKETNRIFEESNRASIAIYSVPLITNREYFYLVIKNFGNAQAIIKNISVDSTTKKSFYNSLNKDFFKYYINATLAPNQNFTHLVVDTDIDQDHISEFTITYQSGNRIYKDTFKFNIQQQHKLPSIGISNASIDKQFLELYQDYLRRNL